MVIEVSLAIIAISMVTLVIALIVFFIKSLKLAISLQTDVKVFTVETARLLNSINDFIRSDLGPLSGETSHLVSNLNSLSSKLHQPLNFFFKGFAKPQQTSDSSHIESPVQTEVIPQLIKWVASGALLFKMAKGILKK